MDDRRILLRGRPGIGKSTVARRIIELYQAGGVPVSGFITEEIREAGRRVGFGVEGTSGVSAVLAHVELPGPPRVGRYGVDLDAFHRVALPAVAIPEEGVVVIDELGKMELASELFIAAVAELFEEEQVPIVATVHAHRHPFTDLLIGRNDVTLMEVTNQNRDALAEWVVGRVAGHSS